MDFEPRRAETPQPIPTWAWVLFLAVTAWTMFYVFNPVPQRRDASAQSAVSLANAGERVYVDTCARCHGEDGLGLRDPFDPGITPVKRLRDTRTLAVAEHPYALLTKIVTGVPGTQMPAWGPRLTNEELVAVVNHIRTAWSHDASTIQPRFRNAPKGIEQLEEALKVAMKRKDAEAMGQCCWPRGTRPILFRVDGPRFAAGVDEVASEWKGYFEALGAGEITDVQLTDVRYDYDPDILASETVKDRTYVFAMGRIFLETLTAERKTVSEKGRFLRLYQFYGGAWTLAFDFADIPMRVGCDPDAEYCPVPEPPGPGPGPGPGPQPAGATTDLGYADVQALFAALGQKAPNAGHENFWELPYEEFVALEFPYSFDDPEVTVRLLVPGDARASNLIRALTDGKGLAVKLADGSVVERDVQRMPKGGKPMPPEQIAALARWIDAGCPRERGGAAPGGPARDSAPPAPGGRVPAYAEVQGYFRDLGQTAPNAGHENFWELPYEEFVALEFPYSFDDPEVTVRLLVPGDARASNLIKALTDGKGLAVKLADGSEVERDVQRMPKGGKPMPPERVAAIARWIDAGCPRDGATGPAAGPAPGPAPEAPPPAAPGVSDLGYAEVVALLKGLKQRAKHAPHGEFWRELSWREFVEFEFPVGESGDERMRLVVPYDGAGSNLIRALKDGKALRVRRPDGSEVERDFERMPKGGAPLSAADLARLKAWVDAGCPEHAGQPSALPR